MPGYPSSFLALCGLMAAMDAPGGGRFPVKVVWPADATRDAAVVTHAAILWDGEDSLQGVYLLLGHLAPPMWESPEDAERQLAESDSRVPIDMRGAFFMTRARAKELWIALGQHLEKAEHLEKGEQQ
jgi:hypothetical protein